MSRAWATGKGQAILLVVLTGLLVVTAIAMVGSPALAWQNPATQSGTDDPVLDERQESPATNKSSGTSDASWTMARANAANTNYINTTGPTNPITTRWMIATEANDFGAGPLVVNGTVYIGTRNYTDNHGTLYAVDAWTGETRWTFQSPARKYPDHIAVLRDTVYVGTYNGKVYAVDAATGDVFWTFQTDGRPKRLTVANRTLFVASKGTGGLVPDGHVYALGALRGEEKWAITTNGPTTGLAVKDGKSYVTTRSGSRVYALDATTGAEQWNVKLNGWLRTPAVANDIVYVGTGNGENLYALDVATGEERWHRQIQGADGITSPSVLENIAYFGAKHLHAVDSQTGTDRWSERSLKGQPKFQNDIGAPVLLNDIGYIRVDGTLYTLDPQTGAHHARFTPPPFNNPWDRFRSGIAVLNGSLYTGVGIDEPNTRVRSDHTIFYALGTPKFAYSNLTLMPNEAEINESVSATVTVRNTGTGPGSFNATLIVDGNVTNATTVRLAPRTSQTVTFSHRFQQKGTYTVEIGDITRRITVGDIAPPSKLTPTAEPAAGDTSPTRRSQETATLSRGDNTPTAAATPTPTSGTAPGFGVGVWVAVVTLVVLGRAYSSTRD